MALNPRLARELKTIEAMVQIYCRDSHATEPDEAVCTDCAELIDYAAKRLTLCPFEKNKPTCGNCTIHCYKQDMREKVRKVMRYSGPKMIRFHPLMAFFHLLDSRIKPKGRKTCDRAAKHRVTRHQQQQ